MVGKTAAGINTVGIEASAGDYLAATRDGGTALYLQRKTSDGEILNFRKDGTTVGSIGTRGSDVYLETGDTGIRMYDQSDAIIPVGSAGVSRDGAIDLGLGPNLRFKDLYLSGGAYLGGTAAANKLDDYEEGTWSPQYTNTTPPTTPYTMDIVSADYVKIGNTVFITANIRTDSVNTSGALGALRISGLPFTCGSSLGIVSVSFAQNWGGDFPSSGYVNSSSTQIILLYRSSANGATFESNAADLTSGVTANQNQLIFSAIYTV